MIMNVAVPLPKHSPMFGHEASSHTVWSWFSRRIRLISKKRGDDGARTRIHGGFGSSGAACTLIGMRAVFAAPVCLTPWALGRQRFDAHAASARCAARIGASSAPAASTVRATPRSASCVTARPLYPQGSMSWKGARSIATFSATPW